MRFLIQCQVAGKWQTVTKCATRRQAIQQMQELNHTGAVRILDSQTGTTMLAPARYFNQ